MGSRKNIAMDQFAEDFIDEITQRAYNKAKMIILKIVSNYLDTQEFYELTCNKIGVSVDRKIDERLSEVEKRIEDIGKDTLRKMKSAGDRVVSRVEEPDTCEAQIMKLEQKIKTLQKEIETLKSIKPQDGKNQTYIFHGGQICGTVHADLVEFYGGQIIDLRANKVEQYNK